MSSPSVETQRQALSAAEVASRKRASASMPPDAWLRLLRELARGDKTNDARRTMCNVAIPVLIVGILASLFLHMALGPATPLVVGVLVAGLAAVIVMRIWLGQVNLCNEFRTLLVPLLETLREDLPANRPLALRLDLRGTDKEKIVREGKAPIPRGNTRMKSITETVYADPWCALRATLAGGHRLQLALTSHYVRAVRRYISVSGKMKSKTKWHKTVVVTMRLAPAAGHVIETRHVAVHAGEAAPKTRQRRGQTLACLKRKFKYRDPAALPSVGDVLEMLMALCAGVTREGGPKSATP